MPDSSKNCPRCGLENAPFGRNKSRPDGLAAYCKMCMRDSRADSAEKNPPDWKAINDRRRARPGYREQERKRSSERTKERRVSEEGYSQSVYRRWTTWRDGPNKEEIRDRANRLRRERYARKQAARTPEDKAAAQKRRKEGWDYWRSTMVTKNKSFNKGDFLGA